MTRDDDSIGGRIKASVSLMVSRVAKEDAKGRTRCKFVGSGGREIGITLTTKKRGDDRRTAHYQAGQSAGSRNRASWLVRC